ncbi:MAG: hypothetical protein BBJ60_06825 [Desulfobacterales bacterium S7086C20]|nr:MAG: hypothetical protein BBJ60_06825 [Desulfobacterales bacterium S7086C20]
MNFCSRWIHRLAHPDYSKKSVGLEMARVLVLSRLQNVQNFEKGHCSVNGLSVDILEVRCTIGTAVRMLHLTVPVLRGFTLLLRKGKTTFHHPQRKIPLDYFSQRPAQTYSNLHYRALRAGLEWGQHGCVNHSNTTSTMIESNTMTLSAEKSKFYRGVLME